MRRFLLALSALFAISFSQSALAAKAPMIFNTGDELFEVAEAPAALKADLRDASNVKLGYFCQHVGIFWADIWTWDCKIALVDIPGNAWGDVPESMAAELTAKHPFSDVKRTFWNRWGAWLIIGGVVILGLIGRRKSKNDEEGELASERA